MVYEAEIRDNSSGDSERWRVRCPLTITNAEKDSAAMAIRHPKSHRVCSVTGCGRVHVAQGFCANHYARAVRRRIITTREHWANHSDIGRLLRRIQNVTDAGCWEWSSVNKYGALYIQGRPTPTHRFSYEFFVGPIPEGFVIDHLCRNTHCINPLHLEPVTERENILRGVGACAVHAKKTHCPRGHPLSDENIYRYPNGRRECRVCARQYKRAYKARLRARRQAWLKK